MYRQFFFLVLLSSVSIWGLGWRLTDNEIHFTAGGSKTFVFRPRIAKAGLICGDLELHFNAAVYRIKGRSEPLSICFHRTIKSASLILSNEYSQVVEVVLPVWIVGKGDDQSQTEIRMFFKMWKGIPALGVTADFRYREPETGESLFIRWESQQHAPYDQAAGTQADLNDFVDWNMTGRRGGKYVGYFPRGENLVVYQRARPERSVGIVSKLSGYYTAKGNMAFRTEAVTAFAGRNMQMDMTLFQLDQGGRAGYDKLLVYRRAMENLNRLVFCSPGSKFGPFRTLSGTEKIGQQERPAVLQSWLSVEKNKKNFKFRYFCEEPEPRKMILNYSAAGDPVWKDDCVELCVARDWRKRGFIQYVANVRGAGTQYQHGISDEGARLDWSVQTAMGADSWQVDFMLTPECYDCDWAEREMYLPFHANREAHSSKEYSGFPSGYFNRPEFFGRLILGTYPEYLDCQKNLIADALTLFKSEKLKNDFTSLCRRLPDFHAGDYFANSLADLQIREFRKRVDFQKNIRKCYGLLERMKKDPKAAAELQEVSSWIRRKIETEDMREEYFRFHSDFMKELSGGRKFLVWNKSPWTYLSEDDYPPSADDKSAKVLHAGIGEYETAAYALSSFLDLPQEISVRVIRNSSGVPVVLRYGHIAHNRSGEQVNDALPLLCGRLKLPARKNREVVIILDTSGLQPGTHELALCFDDLQGSREVRRIELHVHPVRLEIPEKTFNCFFSYVNVMHHWGDAVWEQFRQDMDSHYYRLREVGGWGNVLPKPVFASDGKNRTDYREVLRKMKLYCGGSRDFKMFWWSFHTGVLMRDDLTVRKAFEQFFGSTFMSTEFRRRFSIYLQDLFRLMKQNGLPTDDIYMLIVDEVSRANGIAILKLAKQAVPEIKIVQTVTTHQSLQDVADMMPWIDAIIPHYYTYTKKQYKKQKIWQMLRQHNAGKPKNPIIVSPYFNLTPASSRNEPYTCYRLMGWLTKQVGGHGCGTWTYMYFNKVYNKWDPVGMGIVTTAKRWDSQDTTGEKGAPKLSSGEFIVPSKRWEAYREGMDEFYYMQMLEKKISSCSGSEWSRRAVALIHGAIEEVCSEKGRRQMDMPSLQKLRILHMLESFPGKVSSGR